VRTSFADIEQDFLRFTADIVYCTVTTVDAQGRPRSRVMHPIFEVVDGEPLGWAVTDRSPVKTRHLAANPTCPAHIGVQRRTRSIWIAWPPGSMTSPASGMSGTCSG
jgi:Pyridoxamine 5'-phosphate oxidase